MFWDIKTSTIMWSYPKCTQNWAKASSLRHYVCFRIFCVFFVFCGIIAQCVLYPFVLYEQKELNFYSERFLISLYLIPSNMRDALFPKWHIQRQMSCCKLLLLCFVVLHLLHLFIVCVVIGHIWYILEDIFTFYLYAFVVFIGTQCLLF